MDAEEAAGFLANQAKMTITRRRLVLADPEADLLSAVAGLVQQAETMLAEMAQATGLEVEVLQEHQQRPETARLDTAWLSG